ncbi:GNAT family N-acetyltransferase [Rossellomorea marisflavi]|uniref:GNAT family N-acetyltransferase n=1 Tax=Rossellomorea marisflavi TaxID=189381 RepID=UPI002079537C|nr:GNAT family protein [Rossellomorea marisflavi]USK91424.1 GNAT family N-acetyltransferase [Rossellomorea marisflavi]
MGNLSIRLLQEGDEGSLLAFEEENRTFFQEFSVHRPDDFYTLEGQREMLKTRLEKSEEDQDYHFGIFLDGDELIGTIGLFRIERGPRQMAIIGYSLSQKHNGKGYATEAVRQLVRYGFDVLGLHRIEAGVMPKNGGSIRVLEKAGFEKEGISRKSVKINGEWEDHLILAIINES